MSDDISQLIHRLKAEYLDNRDIGIRRFAQLTNISRRRMSRILDGTDKATLAEFYRINLTVNQIEAKFQQVQARKIKVV